MQLDPVRMELYKTRAPELLADVTSGEAAQVMRREPDTDYCVRFDQGLCAIHKNYGELFLGDACHFYPRIIRQVGEEAVMSAAVSCPEVARLALFTDVPPGFASNDPGRMPVEMKRYEAAGLSHEAIETIHDAFLNAAQDAAPSGRIMARLVSVSASLNTITMESWPEAAPFYLRMVDSRLTPTQAGPADPYRLLHALAILIKASQKPMRPRLREVFQGMERVLNATINWETMLIGCETPVPSWKALMERWASGPVQRFEPILKRWIGTQLSAAFFPFAGFGGTPFERMAILSIRFATMRLGLMSLPVDSSEEDIIRVVQTLARFMDHLADPTLSLAIYQEAGWMEEEKLRALLEI